MRTLMIALGAGALVALASMGTAQAAPSVTLYPWCSSQSSAGSCGFSTAAQCWASVQGGIGYCTMNPFYDDAMKPRQRAPHR